MNFPVGIPPPDEVYQARVHRSRSLMRVISWGMSLRLLLSLGEFIGYLVFGSVALLFDAISTFADLLSSGFLLLSIKLAERPPDKEHPFGHGRYEPLAGMQLGIFLGFGGLALLAQQIGTVATSAERPMLDRRVWLFALAAVMLLEIGFRRIKRIAKEEESPALLAEALHFRTDCLNSLLALSALLLAALFPQTSWLADRLGAIGIALFMVIAGFSAAKKNLNQVLDRVPDRDLFAKVRGAARTVPGVRGTEKLRLQQYGPDAHVDIDVEVDPHLSVEEAHLISQHVRHAIQKAWPQVRDVIVHIEPYYENDHSGD